MHDDLNADAIKDATLYARTTNDKYFADVVANKTNATTAFRLFLPEFVLEQLDLSTLRTVHTRDVGSEEIEKIWRYFLRRRYERPRWKNKESYGFCRCDGT